MKYRMSISNALLAGVLLLALGAGAGLAMMKHSAPKSVIHVVTLYYKDDVTDEQKKSVLAGIEKMADEVPGLKNVWLRSVKVQGSIVEKQADGTSVTRPFTDAFVMEFESEAAFKAYGDHPAHKAWEKIYMPLRGRSSTCDITN
jgi:hypothetical protein